MTVLLERHPVPRAAEVEALLTQLFEREVSVGSTPSPRPGDPVVCAVYRREDTELAGMMVADVAFANLSGAALALIPANKAVEATARELVDPRLFPNFCEVANVATRWFNGPEWPHVVMGSVHGLGEPTPTGTMVFRVAPRARRDYVVAVEGYGQGRLSFLAN